MKPLTFRRASKITWRARWRLVATVMLPVYFLTIVPPFAWAATPADSLPAPVLTPKNVHVNKRQPKVAPYAGVQIPSKPTDTDITYSHAFAEPLVSVGSKTTLSENEALSSAIELYLHRKDDENVSALTDFLDENANSAWRPSLDLNLAEIYYRTGNFSKALDAWEDAWARTRTLTDTAGQKVANLAVGKLAEMKARIGRTDELDALYKQIQGRSVSGPAAQLLVQARSGLWLMHTRPQDAFRCGPSALQELSLATKHKVDHPELIEQSKSTAQGIALSDVQILAGKIDMPMQMAKRGPGAAFIAPAVIHWKLGHYAALIGQRDGKYIVHDTTFGGSQFLMSAQALEQETSGYFLVPSGTLPKGWTSVSKKEGSSVMGRGNPHLQGSYCYDPNAGISDGGDCGSGGHGAIAQSDPDSAGDGTLNQKPSWVREEDQQPGIPGGDAMTESYVKAMLVSLGLIDTPVRYTPSIGPWMHFTVHYNQREIAQPSTFTYSNLGPNWTFSYLAYVRPGSVTASVYVPGGGVETYFYDSNISGYDANQSSQAVLSLVNSNTWQRTLPNGKVETYGQPDGSGNFFLSKISDPLGNTLSLNYDSNFRLVSLTDAIGQVTSVSYLSNTVGNVGFYNIYQVTDPFARSATFAYDTSGRLKSITDIIGITSQFTYQGTSTFINSLTTPYGVTKFSFGDSSTDPSLGSTRWLNTTYPDGNTTRTEYNETVPLSNSDPAGIPSGMYSGNGINNYLQYRNTYYWDKQAMKSYSGNYSKAQITHWLHTSDINTCSDIQESLKKIDQNRIWYAYANQISSIQASDSTISMPTQKGRIMDDGTTQLFQYQYNAIGKVTQQIDPLGRETDYYYASNNIDLLSVKQKNSSSGGGYDLLATYTYNNQHEILTEVDASGQETQMFYYPNGELNYTINPKGQTTTYTYTNDYLTSVTGPVSGATITYAYDGFGRVKTVTDSQGYSTTTNYDAMDRPTLVTYPDGTTSQVNYQNLDVQYTRDRLGRVTRFFYNSIRQPIEALDALGNVTSTYWSLSAGPSSIVDPSGNTTGWKYDSQNRPIEKDYPDGTKIQTSYENTTSRVKTVTDNKGQVGTTAYNEDNTVANVAYTNATIATPTVYYTYDPIYPRIHTMADGTGTTTYNYNPVTGSLGSNMLGSVVVPIPLNSSTYATMSYTSYDQLGRILSEKINDSATGQGLADSVTSFTYDTLGRTTNEANALSGTGTFQYAYLNNTDRVSSITNPNGQSTVYTYQDSVTTPNEPRLTQIQNLNAIGGNISKFNYGYDAQGQITSWTQQNDSNDPQNWANTYDTEGKLTSVNVTDTVTSSGLHQYAYLYDASGNRTSEQIDGNVTGASYNNLNQLTGQAAGGKMVFSGSTGTVPSMVTVGGNTATSSYSTNFSGVAAVTSGTNNVPVIAHDVNGNTSTNTYQVVISPSSASYQYDLNGNLTQDATRNYQWDAKNELTAIVYNSGSNSGNHTEFSYNGSGQRVAIVERTGTTVGSGTIISTKQYVGGEERNASNQITKRYLNQGEQIISGSSATNYFFTHDHLGSLREMIDNNGTTVDARYSYDPYGRPTQVSGSVSSDFQFTGYYYHANSGLFLSATRAYNPSLGRFISRDPSGENSGLNLYAYCDDSPINYTDPSGLDPNPFINPSTIINPFDKQNRVGLSANLSDMTSQAATQCMEISPQYLATATEIAATIEMNELIFFAQLWGLDRMGGEYDFVSNSCTEQSFHLQIYLLNIMNSHYWNIGIISGGNGIPSLESILLSIPTGSPFAGGSALTQNDVLISPNFKSGNHLDPFTLNPYYGNNYWNQSGQVPFGTIPEFNDAWPEPK